MQGGLNLGEAQYGWVMALYGLGATVASLAVGAAGKRIPRTLFILIGAVLTSLAILPGGRGHTCAADGLMAGWPVWVKTGSICRRKHYWLNVPTRAHKGVYTAHTLLGVTCGGPSPIRWQVCLAHKLATMRFCTVG